MNTMCLNLDNTIKHQGPLNVYKVVKKKNGIWYSPYRDCPLPSESELVLEEAFAWIWVDHGLHAFTTLSRAKECAKIFKEANWEHPVFRLWTEAVNLKTEETIHIIRGKIPADGYYYRSGNAIAADKIIWGDEVL